MTMMMGSDTVGFKSACILQGIPYFVYHRRETGLKLLWETETVNQFIPKRDGRRKQKWKVQIRYQLWAVENRTLLSALNLKQ